MIFLKTEFFLAQKEHAEIETDFRISERPKHE
jgi:hypothetical protein